MNTNKKTEVVKGVETSMKIAISAAASILGAVIDGPTGAIVGGGINVLLDKITKEFFTRNLSKNELRRIKIANEYFRKKIEENHKKGMSYRSNFFANLIEEERSAGEELLELTLNALQRDAEEKKLKYYTNLVANILCREDIDQSQANQLVKIAQDLSWTQLLVLATAERRQKKSFALRANEYGDDPMSDKQISLATETLSLYNAGLINFGGDALLGLSDVNPGKMTPQGMGKILCDLMDLCEIEDEKIGYVVKIFSDTSDCGEKEEIIVSSALDAGTF